MLESWRKYVLEGILCPDWAWIESDLPKEPRSQGWDTA